jgi:hypothetical protein
MAFFNSPRRETPKKFDKKNKKQSALAFTDFLYKTLGIEFLPFFLLLRIGPRPKGGGKGRREKK